MSPMLRADDPRADAEYKRLQWFVAWMFSIGAAVLPVPQEEAK